MRSSILPCLLAFALIACDEATFHSRMGQTSAPAVERAVVVLMPIGDSGVDGTVRFDRSGDQLHVTGEIRGLTPGKHGFHVHQYGDLTDTAEGKSAGEHFSPRGMPHGEPTAEERHVGDLGNIVANENGVATIDVTDDVIALQGENSILGRAIVVHEKPDQFTQPSGDAGGRVAFGVIGIAGGADENATGNEAQPPGEPGRGGEENK